MLRALLIIAIWITFSGVALAQEQKSSVPPLTLETAEHLSKQALIERVMAQLAADVVQVGYPKSSDSGLAGPPRWFGWADLMLQPHAAGAYENLCEAQIIGVQFGLTQPPPPRRQDQQESTQQRLQAFDLHDPPVFARGIAQNTLYRVLGPIHPTPYSPYDPETERACLKIKSADKFISAPDAESLWSATWLLRLASEQAASGQIQFKLDCGEPNSNCLKELAQLTSKPLLSVRRSCDELNQKVVPVAENETCMRLRLREQMNERGSGTSTEVIIVASYTGTSPFWKEESWRATIHHVLISHLMTVVD